MGSPASSVAGSPERLLRRDAGTQLVTNAASASSTSSATTRVLPLEQNGSIKSAGSILNADFDAIVEGIVGYGVQICTGVTPTISYPLPSASPGGDVAVALPTLPSTVTTDPWGNPIRYNPSLTYSLTSINASSMGTAFILASNGPDGTAGNADDIQSTVTAAQLIGVFAKTGF